MKLVLYFLLTLVLYACTTKENHTDEQSIRKVILDFQEDFNDGTFNKADSYSTIDWEHINPLGGIDKGREAVLESVRGVHKTFLNGISMTTDSMNIRFITPEVALVTAYHSVDNYTTPDSTKHINERWIKSYALVNQNGKWLLSLDHNTIIQSIAPESGR